MAKSGPTEATDFARQNEAAIREAREADRIEPRANAATYDSEKGLVLVELRSGFAFGFAPERVPGLDRTSAKQLSKVEISPSGDGLRWDDLDVHVSLTGLVAQAMNLTEWAPRIMGQTRSPKKARAARINGLKGGRPRKVATSETRAPKRSKSPA
jgi:hypothetical protein